MSVLPRIAFFFMFSHGIHGIHRTFLLYILPRNSRNAQNLLAVYSPTDCTDFHRCCFQGGALVSSAPTRSVVALLALLVHLRQVHPLKEPICVDLCNLWENTFSNLFREFREFCGRISRQSNLRGQVTSQSPARHARADRRCTARSGGCRTTRHGWQTAVRDVPTRARGGASGR